VLALVSIQLCMLLLLPAGHGEDPASLATMAAQRDSLLDDWRFVAALDPAVGLLRTTCSTFGPDDARSIEAYFRCGTVFHRIGRKRLTQRIYDRTLRWLRRRPSADPRLVASVLERRMVLCKDIETGPALGDSALVYYRRARAVLKSSGLEGTSVHADLLQGWGNILRRLGRLAEAIALYERAVAMRRESAATPSLAEIDTRVWLSHLYWRTGRYDEMESMLNATEADLRRLGAQDHPLLATALSYQLDLAMVRHQKARAWDLVDRLRGFAGRSAEALPPGFGGRLPPFHLLPAAELSLVDHDWNAAFENTARRSGLTSTELQSLGRRQPSAELRRSCQELLEIDPPATTPPRVGLDDLEVRRLTLEAEITRLQAQSVDPVGADEPLLPRLQRSLDAHTAVVGWIRFKHWKRALWAVVVRNEGPAHWTRLGDDAPKRQDAYRRALEDASRWPTLVTLDGHVDRLALQLGEACVEPLLPQLKGIDRLILMPFPETLSIPMESLRLADGRYVADAFETVYAASAVTQAELLERPPCERPRTALVVADPVYSKTQENPATPERTPGNENTLVGSDVVRSVLDGKSGLDQLPPLPASDLEARAVARILESRVLEGRAASESGIASLAFADSLDRYDVIHVASHALFDESVPAASALALTPDRLLGRDTDSALGDGLLTMSEVADSWRLDADLVTLSGCQTGVQLSFAQEAGGGFLAPILGAGARTLLMSRWKVHDHATFLLMRRFYEDLTGSYEDVRAGHVAEPMSKAGALREARHWLRTLTIEDGRTPYAHPVYWSAFFLVGDPR
jgi:CHAT domain-containing protein